MKIVVNSVKNSEHLKCNIHNLTQSHQAIHNEDHDKKNTVETDIILSIMAQPQRNMSIHK